MRNPRGVCRFCGCSEFDPCVVDDIIGVRGCMWTDRDCRLCSVCVPAAKAERQAIKAHASIVGVASFEATFHRGFVVGWFGVRGKFGRNPYVGRSQQFAFMWERGQRAGVAAARVYVQTFGPIGNAPRREVLELPKRGRRAA